MGLNINKLIDFEDDSLWNASGEFEVVDSIFDSVNYCRANFKNIRPPMPEVPKKNMNVYYWACFNMSELSRYTEEQIEFTLKVNSTGKLVFNAWYPENGRAAKAIPAMKKAIEGSKIEDLADLKHLGKPFSYTAKKRTIDDPIIDHVHQARQKFAYITPPVPEISANKLKLYMAACTAFNNLARYTGQKIEFIIRTNEKGSIHCDAWCYRKEQVSKNLPAIVNAIMREDIDSLLDTSLLPSKFMRRADPLREEQYRTGERY